MELPVELEAAIVAAPDERSVYLVAGDWLQQQGDPQGELIALGLATRDDAIDDRVIVLQKQLAPVETGKLSPATIEWRWGFVHGAHIASIGDRDEPALLHALLRSPVARFVQKLVLGPASRRHIDAVVAAKRDVPRALQCVRSLLLHLEDAQLYRTIDFGPLWAALPNLERLVLRARSAVGPIALPRLVELTLTRLAYDGDILERSTLPSLQVLRMQGDDVPLPSMLAPERYPALRTLTLVHEQPIAPGPWRAARIAEQLELLDTVRVTIGRETERELVIDRTVRSTQAGLVFMVGRDPPAGTLVPIDRAPFTIGSLPASQLVLRGREVRPRHLTIGRDAAWALQTAGDAYVTLDGYFARQAPLRSGDEIEIGEHVLRFVEGDIEAQARALRERFRLG